MMTRAPGWFPLEAFPSGVNVEFVDELAPGHVRMRVFERGVGETDSCGTGTVAVASAVARAHGDGHFINKWRSHGHSSLSLPGSPAGIEKRGRRDAHPVCDYCAISS